MCSVMQRRAVMDSRASNQPGQHPKQRDEDNNREPHQPTRSVASASEYTANGPKFQQQQNDGRRDPDIFDLHTSPPVLFVFRLGDAARVPYFIWL